MYRLADQRYLTVPEIHRVGLERGGLLFYEMDYISGVSFGDYTNTAGMHQILTTMSAVIKWIEDQMAISTPDTTFQISTIIEAKKTQLRDRLPTEYGCLIDMLPPVPPAELAVTFCHGDLTFENIIVDSHGEPCLIDPLDSYMPCYFADVTKLAKELWSFWSQLSSGNHVNIGVYHALRRLLLNSRVWEGYDPYMKTLVGIDLLRSLPYLLDSRPSIVPKVIRAYECILTR
jgi:hypothetical protein